MRHVVLAKATCRLALRVALLAGLAAAAMTSGAARAQVLTFGNNASVTSIDPHFYTATPNLEVSKQIFDGLTRTDADGKVQPGLAVSWQQAGPQAWDFRLRTGVTFHDGTPFTADDVAFTLSRVPMVQNSPGSFVIFTRSIERVEVVDPLTVRLHTRGSDPLVPVNLAWVMMLSRIVHADAATERFNDGSLAIGTGPFRFAAYVPGERIELSRNEAYWGEKPAWSRVTNRTIRNAGARTAALLSGDVDIINGVPTADMARLRADSRLRVEEATGLRIVYLGLDLIRPEASFVKGPNGEALERNPLQDQRVRRALSLAVDRQTIADRVMEGAVAPTAQVVREQLGGHVPGLTPATDPAEARRLLSAAGYASGFRITLHGPNDRYLNDARVIQAIGQMWQRVGIQTTVEPMPWTAYAARANRGEFSAFLLGGTAATGEASYPLRSILGLRGADMPRYANRDFVALLDRATATLNDGERNGLLQGAVRMAMNDVAFIPLYIQKAAFAMRRGIGYAARADEAMHASEVRPVP
ncbi:ABC transporter substrate-binding protein (plasmid) [Roseomonas sp. OT10]|uniref:ABC transporter substrate-binding protein n=1 Tax=Roseomonas cutis TaxID=2897332 RepID=UPI001E2ADBFD|nr:ABC transporter substrate-binding protein [Roseomonas sp. OT10]UFN51759.1 ABC transporter substrate-binding protein [Roseomonas sp. OT10]